MLAEQGASHGVRWRLAVDREVDGETLRVWERPARTVGAPTVVLVHGFKEKWSDWSPLAGHLPGDGRLLALDLPWRNGSRHLWAERGSSTTWLERALDLLPVRPDAVVAHSFGATTQLELLTRRTGLPSAPTVLVAPVFRPHDQPVDARFFHEAISRFRGVLADGLRARLGPRAERIPEDIVEAMIGKVRERVEPHGFLQFYAMLGRTPELPLHLVSAPVLVVSGTHDPSAPPAAIDELLASIRDIRLYQDPALTHFCQLEQPDRVAQQVSAFLAEKAPYHNDEEAISA
nr:alpha/beta hydrolase [Streptomyces sp. SID2563]